MSGSNLEESAIPEAPPVVEVAGANIMTDSGLGGGTGQEYSAQIVGLPPMPDRPQIPTGPELIAGVGLASADKLQQAGVNVEPVVGGAPRPVGESVINNDVVIGQGAFGSEPSKGITDESARTVVKRAPWQGGRRPA